MTLPASAQLPNYPGFLNARTYDAEFLRMMNLCQAFGEGIAPFDQSKDCTIASMGLNRATDLEVTTGGSGLNVSVAAGNAWVQGDSRSTQGLYFCYVDVAKTVTLPSNSSGNPRIDAIILQIADSDASGSSNNWTVTFQQGTATVGATLTNLTGAPGQSGGPALNGSALILAYVLVPNGFAGPFVNATHILDRRYFAYRPGRVIGMVSRTTDTVGGAGAYTQNLQVVATGNGVNRVGLLWEFAAARNGTAGTSNGLYLFDGTTAGTIVRSVGFHAPGAAYDMPAGPLTTEIAAFAGQKTLTSGHAPGSGSLTVGSGATSPARLYARYI